MISVARLLDKFDYFQKIFLQFMRSAVLFFIFSFSLCLQAQQTTGTPSSELFLNLQKFNTIGSVLYIAAHPDDENTRLLGYLAREKKLRTGYLSLTRGDGGQNLIGKEQGEALGLIRTQELLAARRIDGAEQFFTRANDFGFSKSPEETFSIWNKDSVLADVVWIIRRFKPDVIICRFPTTGEGGHGHHTASAILAGEAFDAAADPKKFPEQLKYTQTWQAKRLFWNTFNFGSANTTATDQLKIDVGVYNPLIGKSFGEIAAESRSMHKSQGFGSAKQRGSNIEYFKQLKGEPVKNDLFENLDFTWARFAGAEIMIKMQKEGNKAFDLQSPEKLVPILSITDTMLQSLSDRDPLLHSWKLQKSKELEELILSACGLWLEASTSDFTGIPGNEVTISAQIVVRNPEKIKLKTISFLSQSDTTLNLEMNTNELYTFKHKGKLPITLPYSNPYWLTEAHGIGRYTVADPLLRGRPENDPATKVVFHLLVAGKPLKIERNLVYKNTDPVKGEIYRPFEVLPPATVNISEKVIVFNDLTPKKVHFIIKANANNISGKLDLKAATGWNIDLQQPSFSLPGKGEEVTLEATITPTQTAVSSDLQASVIISGKSYVKSIQRIDYDHIPYQFILSDAKAKLITIDLKKTGSNIGYIPGAGDDVATCLTQIGYSVTMLTDDRLSNEDLSGYDAIVTGVRAYNTYDRLQIHYSKLMDYVRNGGNLIVQYNTNSRIGPVLAKIGPYPFTISRDRVTDEKAEIRIVNPKHSVLNFPNVIGKNDFDGWIQERGIYFATDIDKKYETVFSMKDAGEKESDGSLIIAKEGKGNFVYTGLVFFRELPAGVPGAYRLFVNLLSLPKNQ